MLAPDNATTDAPMLKLWLPCRCRCASRWAIAIWLACLTALAAGQLSAQTRLPSDLQSAVPSQLSPNTSAATRQLSQSEEAQILMERALLSGVWGPPVHCFVAQEINVLGRIVRGSGLYARGRSGFGEMKLSLKIVAGDHLNILDEVSDGRMLHISQTIDGTRECRRIDLDRVREYLGRFTEQDRTDPLVALHLAIGGQNEKLRALCQQYKWVSVQPGKFSQPGKMGEIDVWWLRGERASEPVPLHGLTEMDNMLASADGAGLAPDHARIAIGRTPPLQYWLYHVEESRRAKTDGPSPGYSLVAKIDYYQPVIREMPETMFDYDPEAYAASVERMVDETRKYTPPSRQPASQTAARP